MRILVQSEPIADERVRVLIDEELKSFNIKQGDTIKKIEDLNEEFIKNHSQSLTHRAEGTFNRFFFSLNFYVRSLAAKVMLLINPTNQSVVIEFLTKLDPNFTDQNIKVRRLRLRRSFSNNYSFRSVLPSTKICNQVIMVRLILRFWRNIVKLLLKFGHKQISFNSIRFQHSINPNPLHMHLVILPLMKAQVHTIRIKKNTFRSSSFPFLACPIFNRQLFSLSFCSSISI